MKTKTLLGILLCLLIGGLFASCSDKEKNAKDEVERPVINFDAPEDVYTVKTGKTLLLSPEVENNRNASYRWMLDGKVIGRDATYTFNKTETGQYFITFEVSNELYTVEKEIRVDVLAKVPPTITLPLPEGGFILLVGTEKTFEPIVSPTDDISFSWFVDEVKVAETQAYAFASDSPGEFTLIFRAINEDGGREVEFPVSVRNLEDLPFRWVFETTEFNMTMGRSLYIAPLTVSNAAGAVYSWTVDGVEVQRSDNPEYKFLPGAAGSYKLTITMENEFFAVKQELVVHVFDPKEARPITAQSQPESNKVYEFLPAPGQFVNEYYTVKDMTEACRYAENRMAENAYVSLGAFGGYIVVGFDHSLVNDGGYNIQILGNSFDGSSEPGIVWVMQDENGDGEPNDTWYELKGSEYGKPETLQNYAVTYYKPSAPGMDVAWTDNRGNQGTVDYLIAFHTQDYYYPAWVHSSSYTLRGTRLQDKTEMISVSFWVNGAYDWGYADNFSPIDRLTDDENHNAGVNANHFRISDAVTYDGKPANLPYIDFVKVQTGVQAKAGWLGEVSTEIFGVRDFNLLK